jgi:hypothetical protein
VATIIAHRPAVGQHEVDAFRAIERASAAERDDAVDVPFGSVLTARLDHLRVGIGAEAVKKERHDADRVQKLRGAVHETRGDNPFVRHDQRAREAKLVPQEPKLLQHPLAEDEAGSQCEIKWGHQR